MKSDGIRRCGARGVTHQQLGFGERRLIRGQNLVLHGGGRKPTVVRRGMPFAPKAEQSYGYKSDTRIAVVTRAKGGNEVRQRLPQTGIAVIRADARAVAVI